MYMCWTKLHGAGSTVVDYYNACDNKQLAALGSWLVRTCLALVNTHPKA